MTVATTITPIKITNNTIDYSLASPDGITTTAYTYGSHISVNDSATISGNTISGASISENMVIISSSGSCILTNNIFIRNSTSIQSYILVSSSKDQIITNNIFDQTTIDGSSTVLANFISGVPNTTVYANNLNQPVFTQFIYALQNTFTVTGTVLTATNFSLAFNGSDNWFIEWDLQAGVGTSSTGIAFALSDSSGAATLVASGIIGPTDSSNSTFISNTNWNSGFGIPSAVFCENVAQPGVVRIWAVIKGGGTAGNIVLKAKCSNTNSAFIFAGSIMRARLLTGYL